MSSWNIPEKDRITIAWELRRDIHAWLMENSRATMPEMFKAFAHMNHETVRKAVYRMRTDGDVAMIARNRICNAGVYAAMTKQIKSEDAKRDALAKGARKTQHKAVAASSQKATEKRVAKQKEPPPPKVGPNGGRINTRYDDPNARPLPNQGGQGTIGVQPRGVSAMLGE